METKYSIIADLLILLILFCESCGRGVINPEGKVSFVPTTAHDQNQNGVIRRSLYSWYSTPSPYMGHSPFMPSDLAAAPAYQSYFNRGGTDYGAPGEGHGGMSFFDGLDASMTNMLRPSSSYHDYSHGYGNGITGELIRVNTKGFALLGLLGLMAILQGLLNSVITQFTTTTTDAPTGSAAAAVPGAVGVAAPSRKKKHKRSLTFDPTVAEAQKFRIQERLLPSLNAIAHVQTGMLQFSCAFHELCFVRQILEEELPEGKGRYVVAKLFQEFEKFLKPSNDSGDINLKQIRMIGEIYRTHDDCTVYYPICPDMMVRKKYKS